MPKVACLDKFKKVLAGIPEIDGFPIRGGRTFKIKYVDGLTASFDLLCKKRVQNLVVECCQNLSMQQLLVGLPMNFGKDQLELVVARAMLGFSKNGIKSGLGNCPLFVKGLITGKVQSLMHDLVNRQIAGVPRSKSWSEFIDYLIDNVEVCLEKDPNAVEYWGIKSPTRILTKAKVFDNQSTAESFWRACAKHNLIKRIGPAHGRGSKWNVYNLPWPESANGKDVVTEAAPISENSGPPVDLLVSALLEETADNRKLQEWLESSFGDNPEIARSFAEKCGKQIERIEKVKKAAELYADFVAGMNSL